MGGGARTLVKQPKTAVFFAKMLKPGGSQSVKQNSVKFLPKTKNSTIVET